MSPVGMTFIPGLSPSSYGSYAGPALDAAEGTPSAAAPAASAAPAGPNPASSLINAGSAMRLMDLYAKNTNDNGGVNEKQFIKDAGGNETAAVAGVFIGYSGEFMNFAQYMLPPPS
jgi:hypothetical protein